jgi:hypothetical protein
MQSMACIDITLSQEEPEEKGYGYQVPMSKEEFEEFKKQKAEQRLKRE